MGQTGAVGDVFEVGEGFGIGVGNARTENPATIATFACNVVIIRLLYGSMVSGNYATT